MGKTIKVIISVSILLNVLLIGIITGIISNRLFRDEFPGKHPQAFTAKLPPEKEKLFFNTMEKVRSENREVHKQIGEARERILLILNAPEFDEEAYQVETTKLDKLHGLMMQGFSNATKKLAKQLNQEERKILADFLRQPPPLPASFGGRTPTKPELPPGLQGPPRRVP